MLPDDGFARTYHPVVIGHHSSYPPLGNTFKDASNRSRYRAERRTTDVRCRETVLDTGDGFDDAGCEGCDTSRCGPVA